MKRSTLILSALIIFLTSHLNAQLLLEENFEYEPGLLSIQSNGNWFVKEVYQPDIYVINGNLSSKGYASSEQGNYIFIGGSNSQGGIIRRQLKKIVKSSIYISFIIMPRDTLNLYPSVPDYQFFHLFDSIGLSGGNIYLYKSAVSGSLKVGINKARSDIKVYSDIDIPVMNSALLVLKYCIYQGEKNDSVKLWINPPLTETEPKPDICTGSSSVDLADISELALKQSNYGGNLFLDGIRVSTSWSDAPLPVELSSFAGSVRGDKVILDWKTETEIDNYGFDVERKTSVQGDWNKIGFVYGHGNSNSPKFYSFTDNNIYGSSTCLYRLKQIDKDGSSSFSDEVKIDIVPADFILFQNYPNPFNPSTLIRFSLPEDAFTSVKIYNPVGERISVLLNEYVTRGYHEIYFNASGINSGIYICVVEACGRRKVIKLVLAR